MKKPLVRKRKLPKNQRKERREYKKKTRLIQLHTIRKNNDNYNTVFGAKEVRLILLSKCLSSLVINDAFHRDAVNCQCCKWVPNTYKKKLL